MKKFSEWLEAILQPSWKRPGEEEWKQTEPERLQKGGGILPQQDQISHIIFYKDISEEDAKDWLKSKRYTGYDDIRPGPGEIMFSWPLRHVIAGGMTPEREEERKERCPLGLSISIPEPYIEIIYCRGPAYGTDQPPEEGGYRRG